MTNEQRQQRITRIRAESPDDTYFEGFGGSAQDAETLVFSCTREAPAIGVRPPYSFEIRIPVNPAEFAPESIENEYGCVSIREWSDLADRIE